MELTKNQKEGAKFPWRRDAGILDRVGVQRLGEGVWGELSGSLANSDNFEEYLRQTDAIAVNDCKSLADASNNRGSAVSKTSED